MFDLTLSFDNGPTAAVTPGVLDVLAERGLRATFFVVGQRLADPAARAATARAWETGHWIGNHSWSHATPLGELTDDAAAEREILDTQAAIAPWTHPDRLFRPFGGGGRLGPHLLSPAARRVLESGGYTCVLWNAVPGDWRDPDGWVETALAQCAERPRTLLVLHDLPSGAMRHLPRFLDAAAARGARFRQDFPPDCVPLRRGHPTPALDAATATP